MKFHKTYLIAVFVLVSFLSCGTAISQLVGEDSIGELTQGQDESDLTAEPQLSIEISGDLDEIEAELTKTIEWCKSDTDGLLEATSRTMMEAFMSIDNVEVLTQLNQGEVMSWASNTLTVDAGLTSTDIGPVIDGNGLQIEYDGQFAAADEAVKSFNLGDSNSIGNLEQLYRERQLEYCKALEKLASEIKEMRSVKSQFDINRDAYNSRVEVDIGSQQNRIEECEEGEKYCTNGREYGCANGILIFLGSCMTETDNVTVEEPACKDGDQRCDDDNGYACYGGEWLLLGGCQSASTEAQEAEGCQDDDNACVLGTHYTCENNEWHSVGECSELPAVDDVEMLSFEEAADKIDNINSEMERSQVEIESVENDISAVFNKEENAEASISVACGFDGPSNYCCGLSHVELSEPFTRSVLNIMVDGVDCPGDGEYSIKVDGQYLDISVEELLASDVFKEKGKHTITVHCGEDDNPVLSHDICYCSGTRLIFGCFHVCQPVWDECGVLGESQPVINIEPEEMQENNIFTEPVTYDENDDVEEVGSEVGFLCDDCGKGFLNVCDEDECASLGNCWWDKSYTGLSDKCYDCKNGENTVSICSDYSDEYACFMNRCHVEGGCRWEKNSCVSLDSNCRTQPGPNREHPCSGRGYNTGIEVCTPSPPIQTFIDDKVLSDATIMRQVERGYFDDAVRKIWKESYQISKGRYGGPACTGASKPASKLIDGSAKKGVCNHWAAVGLSLIRSVGVPEDRVYIIDYGVKVFSPMGHDVTVYKSDSGEWWVLDYTCCRKMVKASEWHETCGGCSCFSSWSITNDYGVFDWDDENFLDGQLICKDRIMIGDFLG